jgi:DnaK suppressor protein
MKISRFKDMLLEMRNELLQEIAGNVKMEIGHLQEAIADMYDLADDERERQFSILLCDRDREKLLQIDDALERIEDGSYGICEECDSKISEKRLDVMPFARYCVPCKNDIEKNEKFLRGQNETFRYRGIGKETEEAEE